MTTADLLAAEARSYAGLYSKVDAELLVRVWRAWPEQDDDDALRVAAELLGIKWSAVEALS